MNIRKVILILCFSLTNFESIYIKNNASEISSEYRLIKFNRENSTYHSKNTQSVKDLKGDLSNKSSKSFVNQMSRILPIENLNEKQVVVSSFISDILTHTLNEENIFLLYDREILNMFELTEVFLLKNLKDKPHIALEMQEFDIDHIDNEIVSGCKYTTFCLIYNQNILLDLFLNKTTDIKWAPAKLLIISLDHRTNISDVIFDSSIQRSKYIFIAELTVKRKMFAFQTYSVFPFQRNKTGFSQWKAFKGIYNLPRMKSEIFTERTKNFGRKLLHLASICNDPPFLYWVNTSECIGTNIEILHIISKSLNFRFSVQNNTEDGFWAGIENNTFKGIYRDIYHNNKSMIINFLRMQYYEQPYFDSSFPYKYTGAGFLCKITGLTPIWKKIFMPFSFNLWSLLLSTIIILIPIHFFLIKVGYTCANNSRLSTSFLVVFGIVFRQTVDVTNRSIWYLLHLTVWLIGSFVIMSAYSGNLISFMTFPGFQSRIETIKEVANSNLRVGFVNYGVPLKRDFLASPIEDIQILGKKLVYYTNTESGLARAVELVKNNYHVLVDGYDYLNYLQITFNISEETYLLKEQILKGYLSFYFKKHSPLTHPVSTKLTRLIETGIYSRIYEKHASKMKKAQRNYKKIKDKQQLKIAHLQTAFYLLFLGSFISMVIFMMEIIIHCNKN
ncbi:UNVERIFIED_CONTAM: hypothetical protein RMT77_011687 [Armadillidium vulgare]